MERQFRNIEYKKKEKRISGKWAVIALCICLFALAGLYCHSQQTDLFSKETLSHPKVDDKRSKEEARSDFDKLLQQIFREEVTDNTILLNYSVKDKNKYGLKEIAPTLGEFSLEELNSSLLVSENRVATLETYDYNKLTEEQKLIYDIIYKMSKDNLTSADFLEYAECLGPTTGIQAQLPIYFAEYNFYEKKDVEDYIALLKLVPSYFGQIIEFEKNKSQKGIFMSDVTAQAIIDQCREFIKTPEKNYLITNFTKRVEAVPGLSKEEKRAFTEANKKAVSESVIPAYKNLIQGLESLKGSGKNGGGLCHFEKGEEYYAYLVKAKTGSDRSLEEINRLLDDNISRLKKDIADIMADSPDAYYDATELEYPYNTPQKSMDHLKEAIAKDFPALREGITCQLKQVDASLEENLSPAFFLTPAMDNYEKNVMYINGNKKYDLSKAFTTIGHESYPGHLYQICYFLSKNSNPVRNVITVSGYTEGWGTYAELYSYDLADIDKEVAKLLKKNTLATLCIYGKADLAVNYLGWDYKKLQNYLEDFGFQKENCRTIYDSMVAEPGEYMVYTLGYLEIQELLERAREELGGKFEIKKFHEFFLDIGPAPFVVIQDRMDQWLQKQR